LFSIWPDTVIKSAGALAWEGAGERCSDGVWRDEGLWLARSPALRPAPWPGGWLLPGDDGTGGGISNSGGVARRGKSAARANSAEVVAAQIAADMAATAASGSRWLSNTAAAGEAAARRNLVDAAAEKKRIADENTFLEQAAVTARAELDLFFSGKPCSLEKVFFFSHSFY